MSLQPAAQADRNTMSPTYADVVKKRPFEAVLNHSPPKRPRGRPPTGAVLDDNGAYVMSPESIEVAAERLKKHREQCRERYRATRAALQAVKPELFKNDGGGTQQNLQRFECPERNGLSEGSRAAGHQSAS